MKNSIAPIHPILDMNQNLSELTGLSKREYAAIIAMQNIDPPNEFYGKKETEESYERWAKKCVRMADAILKQLEQ